MISTATNQRRITTGRTAETRTLPWWAEMILVDFRHAFWPWIIYTAALFGIWFMKEGPLDPGPDAPNYWLGVMAIIALVGPAIVTRVFATDFSHSTISTLLTTPRSRSQVFFVRTGFVAALYLIPAIIVAIPLPHPWTSWINAQQYLISAAIVVVIMIGLFYTAVGAALTITLNRPLLVWSAIVISPLIVLILSVLIEALTSLDLSIQPGETLGSPVNNQFWYFTVVDIAAFLLAWRLWLRLEVRS